MADDLDATMEQIAAAREQLAPQIRGMRIILGDASRSPELKREVQVVHDDRMHRDQLCLAALDALAALKDDGYPELPPKQMQNSLLSEMKEENEDLDAAAAAFSQQSTVAIGNPSFTRQNEPSEPGP